MEAAGGGWGDEDELDLGGAGDVDVTDEAGLGMEEADGFPRGSDDEDGGWEMEDLDIPDVAVDDGVSGAGKTQFVAPTPGVPPQQRWQQKCNLAGEYPTISSLVIHHMSPYSDR